MSTRWDETWHRLRDWTNGQGPAERLSTQILLDAGYEVDPSHPLGGKDGLKDAICMKDGRRWIMAAYFPRGEKSFSDTKKKFCDDAAGIAANNAIGIAFVTNQELTLSRREQLLTAVDGKVDLFHLERITSILDKPMMGGVRNQFLGIEPSGESVSIVTGKIILRSGDGGDASGGASGGAGAPINIIAGNGGNATEQGSGGTGGSISISTRSGEDASS